MTDPIRVFLLDDHEIVRSGVVRLLVGRMGLEVAAEASTAADTLAAHIR